MTSARAQLRWARLRARLWGELKAFGRWPMDAWASSCRDADIEVLWPRLKAMSDFDLETARMAMLFHADRDWAWRRLPENETAKRIAELK